MQLFIAKFVGNTEVVSVAYLESSRISILQKQLTVKYR